MYSHTWDMEWRCDLSPGLEMLMPGDNAEVFCTIRKQMVLEPNQRFTVRENHQTVATGVITKLLSDMEVTSTLNKLKTEQILMDIEPLALKKKA